MPKFEAGTFVRTADGVGMVYPMPPSRGRVAVKVGGVLRWYPAFEVTAVKAD